MEYRIGEIELTQILETSTRLDARLFFTDYDQIVDPGVAKSTGDLDDAGTFPVDFHSWVVALPDRTILVDPCIGNHKPRAAFPPANLLDTAFLERLQAAGVESEDVDDVVCTHLHFDHCGWNTMLRNGSWIPTFPNATYRFAATELEYWRSRSASGAGFHEEAFRDSVAPVLAAGMAAPFNGVLHLDESVTIEPAPGHTPGHTIVRISSLGQTALFIGDVVHSMIQTAYPRLNAASDVVPEESARTRAAIFDEARSTGALILPAHLPAPYCFRLG